MVDWINFASTLAGVFVGGGLTYLTQRRLERLREKREHEKSIYLPLYDEILLNIAVFETAYSQYHHNAWAKIKKEHLTYYIESEQLRKSLEELYSYKLGNCMVYRWDLLDDVRKIIRNKVKTESLMQRGEVFCATDTISPYFIMKNPISTIQAKEALARIQNKEVFPYSTLNELEQSISSEITNLESHKKFFKERTEILHELNRIEQILRKKLKIKNKPAVKLIDERKKYYEPLII